MFNLWLGFISDIFCVTLYKQKWFILIQMDSNNLSRDIQHQGILQIFYQMWVLISAKSNIGQVFLVQSRRLILIQIVLNQSFSA